MKSKFRRAVKTFFIKDSHLFKDNKLVIKDRARQLEIVRDVHRGLGDSENAKALSAHRGKNSTHEKIAARFFWYKISADVVDYIKTCEQCQKQGDIFRVLIFLLDPNFPGNQDPKSLNFPGY